ncbi:hypothetical protein RB195_006754 [Necator americanus]|uniref:Uncharacterized protein n=1 Tax=Necator americanus TaxID=51031 RepID=A0ABR1BU30_NECAM
MRSNSESFEVYGRVYSPYNELRELADESSRYFYPTGKIPYQFIDLVLLKCLIGTKAVSNLPIDRALTAEPDTDCDTPTLGPEK